MSTTRSDSTSRSLLREALEWWEANPGNDSMTGTLHRLNQLTLVAAARRFLALTETDYLTEEET